MDLQRSVFHYFYIFIMVVIALSTPIIVLAWEEGGEGTVTVRSEEPASFTISVNPTPPITLGTYITIEGILEPFPSTGFSTHVVYTRPDGTTYSRDTVHAQQTGPSFTVDYYKPDIPGVWSVYAIYNPTGLRSNVITFEVMEEGFTVSISTVRHGVYQGQSSGFEFEVQASKQRSYTVSLSISGLPSGVTATFTPQQARPPFTCTLTLHASPSTPVGDYTITVTGTGGGYTSSDSFTLSVYKTEVTSVGVGTFSITLKPGETKITTIEIHNPNSIQISVADFQVTDYGGFQGSIIATNLPLNINPGGVEEVILSVSANPDCPPGTYTIRFDVSGTP